MKKRCIIFVISVWILTGCIQTVHPSDKVRELSFIVLEEREIPLELKAQIEKEKTKSFMLTYADKGKLYIARGYGMQDKTGYSVEVTSLYETTTAVVIETHFAGPEKNEKTEDTATYPFVVVELEEVGKEVIFQ